MLDDIKIVQCFLITVLATQKKHLQILKTLVISFTIVSHIQNCFYPTYVIQP